jgi:hypothetical protein
MLELSPSNVVLRRLLVISSQVNGIQRHNRRLLSLSKPFGLVFCAGYVGVEVIRHDPRCCSNKAVLVNL